MESQVTQEQLVASARLAYERATGKKNLSNSPTEGYYTATQWSQILGNNRNTARERLEKLVSQGKASKEFYTIQGHATAHYKIKDTE